MARNLQHSLGTMPSLDIDRQALASIAHQLATCAKVARAITTNSLGVGTLPSALTCDVGTLQLSLELQQVEVQRILSHWPIAPGIRSTGPRCAALPVSTKATS